jgi:ribosomal-protein-alanine N-acetyltransferase
MRPRIRQFRDEDLVGMAEIEKECFPGPEGLTRRQLSALAKREDVTALVAEYDGIIGGFALVHIRDSRARLLTIDVGQELRGKGIGSVLLDAADKLAVKSDCESISLEARVTNLAAISLYRKAGYSEMRIVAAYYPGTRGRSTDALEMEKMISRPQ